MSWADISYQATWTAWPSVNFIPHTKVATTWGDVGVGDAINLEVDTMARYVARLQDYS